MAITGKTRISLDAFGGHIMDTLSATQSVKWRQFTNAARKAREVAAFFVPVDLCAAHSLVLLAHIPAAFSALILRSSPGAGFEGETYSLEAPT
jgi:hypothetical protein